jgi:hypothetical protein
MSDGNICTDDHCSGGGACVHTNNVVPCNDGLFCNGTDHCSGGGCNTHSGDPCAGGPVCADICNEAADNCLDPAGTVCRPAAGQCDVAETCTGTSSGCPADAHKPDGTACNDANACTSGDQCTGGVCGGTTTVVCDPCEICTPAGGCALPTAPGCQPAVTKGASILLRDGGALPDKDTLKWKWKSSASVALGDFGDPTTTTDLTVCVIDQGGLKLSATAPAGGTCRTKPCWSVVPGKKVKYKDADLTPDGMQKMLMQEGGPGSGKILAKGKGANLGVPALGLTTPVTVRLVRSGGSACWEATYSTNVIQSTADTFKAKSE